VPPGLKAYGWAVIESRFSFSNFPTRGSIIDLLYSPCSNEFKGNWSNEASFCTLFVHRFDVRQQTKFVDIASFRPNWSICVKCQPARLFGLPATVRLAARSDKFPFGIKMLES
jgi:hypothetical protein